MRIITRSQTIHECLHVLYTDFPSPAAADPKCGTPNRRKAMALIENIIEDAYIEAVGCSCFDNLAFYLRFGRAARLFASHPAEGTASRSFRKASGTIGEEKQTAADKLIGYLNYMIGFLLYPMVVQPEPPRDIAAYVQDTRQLFLDGSVAPAPAERYRFSSQIFDIVLPLIPPDDEELPTSSLEQRIGGARTHSAVASTIGQDGRKGRTQAVTGRLFADWDGARRPDRDEKKTLLGVSAAAARDRQAAAGLAGAEGRFLILTAQIYDCAALHKDIHIHENHPKINLNLRRAYQNIYARYSISIRSYRSRFSQLLKAHAPSREDKYKFGAGIASGMLGDPQKRYWYRDLDGSDIPDLAVLLLIDGSGSMNGPRCQSAMRSAVILHEVLQAQGISHAIVEHRARFAEPDIDINILVDFYSRKNEKLNLMQIAAYGDNRDGLALFWAEKYLGQHTGNDHRLILVLSDGAPSHDADDYYPPVSTKDTANAVRKITRRGTDIIAVSLDDEDDFSCYDHLKDIYPNLIACNDLSRLTGQLLGVIARLL